MKNQPIMTRRTFMNSSAKLIAGGAMASTAPLLFTACGRGRETDSCGPPLIEQCEPTFTPRIPFDLKARPLTWPFEGGEFRWEIPNGDIDPVSEGEFSLVRNGTDFQSGYISADTSGCDVSVNTALIQGLLELEQKLVGTIIDPGPEAREVRIESETNGLKSGFTFNFMTREFSDVNQNEEALALLEKFDLSVYQNFAQVAIDDILPPDVQLCQLVANAGWTRWEAVGLCVVALGVGSWCLSVFLGNAAGASCCTPTILPVIMMYATCVLGG